MYKTAIFGSGFLGKYFYQAFSHLNQLGPVTQNSSEKKDFFFDAAQTPFKNISVFLTNCKYAIIAISSSGILNCTHNAQKTFFINVECIFSLIQKLVKKNICPIVFSSDYVFDGKKGGYTEKDLLNPLNEHGRQKAELDRKILQNYPDKCLIIRLSKVYNLQKGSNTLLDEIALSLYKKKSIKAAYDQIFCPVYVEDVINAVIELQKKEARGLFHLCGKDKISRYALAVKIARHLKADTSLIEKTSLKDLNEPFQRPRDTSLNCHKITSVISLQRTSLNEHIKKLSGQYAKN